MALGEAMVITVSHILHSLRYTWLSLTMEHKGQHPLAHMADIVRYSSVYYRALASVRPSPS